jgi:Protein of unknown function (DUF3306)
MNDPNNFLSRWSRRKREADALPKTDDDKATTASVRHEATSPDGRHANSATPLPEFDVSKLPPLESISAGTDITAFMQAGVPSALRHAALRRAWSTDPAVRDFVGLNENFWDGAGPEGIPGFGDLNPNLDVKRLISELFGETPAEKPQAEAPTATPSAEISDARETDDKAASETETELSKRTENAATQKESSLAKEPKRVARRHGGALPQ